MNRLSITSLAMTLALLASGPALAADEEKPLARTAVVAERDAAIAAGTIGIFVGEDSGDHHLGQQRWQSTRSRADVVADAIQARRNGELAAMNGEDGGSAYLAQQAAQPATRYVGPNHGADDVVPVSRAVANAATGG